MTMTGSIYRKIGFSEPPFIEAGAATNVTPYIPEKLLKQLNSTVEFTLGGQCRTLILGGAAGSGKTTITRYYFNYAIYNEFGDRISKSLVVIYTITDVNELRDVPIFYRHLIQEILAKVKDKDPIFHQNLFEKVKEYMNSQDALEMLKLFKEVNILLRENFRPIIYVIDEVDYVVDLINEKDDTFIQHLRHIIDILSEIRYTALILASTKLPASYIKNELRKTLGPTEDRISESEELRYSEEDFLKFVQTRFKEPLIEEKDGQFIKRTIRLEPTRSILEKEYGIYFPFTEGALKRLYQREKGQGVTIEKLRLLERHLAKLINIYCSEEFASILGMKASKIFDENDIDKFLTIEEAKTTPVVVLTPKEEEWFTNFFGFKSDQFRKFSQERCVCALALALLKYLEQKLQSPGIFPLEPESIKQYIKETQKGLNFFAYISPFVFGPYNLAMGVTLLRSEEIEKFGWDSLKEVVDDLYELRPIPQKKIIVIGVEDDFEFADVSSKLIDFIRPQERKLCVKEEDINNIEVINEKLMIKSANSFRVVFLKCSNFLEAVSICAKSNKSEIEKIGDQYFESLYIALNDWALPSDFFNYTPSTERILQAALLLIGTQGKISFSEWTLENFFNRIKLKRDRFNFNELTSNGFARMVETEVFQFSIPPTLTYLLNNYKHFSQSQILNEFGDNIGEEIIEFLTSFLKFEANNDVLNLTDLNLIELINSTKKLIEQYVNLTKSGEFKSHFEVLEEIEGVNFQRLDEQLGLRIMSGFSFSERAVAKWIETVILNLERQIREAKEHKKTVETKKPLGIEEEPPQKKVLISEEEFLNFVMKPKTWNQIRQKYTKQQLPDEELWRLIRKLHDENKILIRVRRR
ncbi:MAG: ATP-binding protein [Nitrososphaeria archaeon]